ncbi:MAG: hypothetical protein WCT49_02650 [Candidatus Paceibacterota bacterium]|jgi:hypothetical protein|nr:hypothetical protein [Candidatus Paceibacterota bacterium]
MNNSENINLNEQFRDNAQENPAFYTRLKELSGDFPTDNIKEKKQKYAKDVSAFINEHSQEISEGLRGIENQQMVFKRLNLWMTFANGGDKHSENKYESFNERKNLAHELLYFLNNEKDFFAAFLSEKIKTDGESNKHKLNERMVWSNDELIFFRNYFAMASSVHFTEPLLGSRSILSFLRSVAPVAEMAKTGTSSTPDLEPYTDPDLNIIALLAGDTNVAKLWAEKFSSNDKLIPFDRQALDNFFPSKDSALATYSSDFSAEKMNSDEIKNTLLVEGFGEDEISHAFELVKHSAGDRLLEELLSKKYDLPFVDFQYAWKNGNGDVWNNLCAIRSLEDNNPGSAKKLAFTGPNKIRFFERYDLDLLLEQLEPLAPGEPYGVMCTAYQDHNGAFKNRKYIHEKIRNEGKKLNIKTRVIEYSNPFPFAPQMFDQLSKIAPPQEKQNFPQADFIWINQHGRLISGDLKEFERENLRWKNVFGVGENKSSLVIKENGAVASFMCYGGAPDHAMEQISKNYGVKATGPKKAPASIAEIAFSREESGKLAIDVVYEFENDKNDKNLKISADASQTARYG